MKMKALHRPVLCTSMKIIQRFKFFKNTRSFIVTTSWCTVLMMFRVMNASNPSTPPEGQYHQRLSIRHGAARNFIVKFLIKPDWGAIRYILHRSVIADVVQQPLHGLFYEPLVLFPFQNSKPHALHNAP